MPQDAHTLLLDAPASVLFPPRMAIKPSKLPGAAHLAGTRFLRSFGDDERFRVAAYDQEKRRTQSPSVQSQRVTIDEASTKSSVPARSAAAKIRANIGNERSALEFVDPTRSPDNEVAREPARDANRERLIASCERGPRIRPRYQNSPLEAYGTSYTSTIATPVVPPTPLTCTV